MSNSSNTPQPIHTFAEVDFFWMDKLPKRLRTFAIECLYDYDGKMLYDMYQQVKGYWFDEKSAVSECIQQLRLNDEVNNKAEMEKKWTTSNYSIASNWSPRNSRMRRTVTTATRLATTRSHPGSSRLSGKRTPSPMEFSLYGTTPS